MLHNVEIIEMKLVMCYNKHIIYGIGVLMKKFKNKKGFTLAEVMIVLLVLTILFAACAPLITKRRRANANKQEVWMWSSRNYLSGPMDIYYKPLSDSYLGGVYIGATPDSENEIKSSYIPLSKLVIRSGYILGNTIQRQLQLRYGRSGVNWSNDFDDNGQLGGTFLADGQNLLFGSIYPYLEYKCENNTYPRGNIGYGYYSMNSIMDANYDTANKACNNSVNNSGEVIENNTAFGYNTLSSIYKNAKDNTVIGSGAGATGYAGKQNTFIGYSAGYSAILSSNTLIGYNSQARKGSYNTFVGADTGYDNHENIGETDYQYNVALGYKALGQIINGNYNVAIGSGALGNLSYGYNNVAIGYNACFGVKAQSNKTCIGAWSGPASDSPVLSELNIYNEKNPGGSLEVDDTQITYIGANPNIDDEGKWTLKSKYGGDAVMEIYNSSKNNNKLINSPVIDSNATTVINGNLIVKGKTYLTMGNILYPFSYSNDIFGANPSVNCATNQSTYGFTTTNADCTGLAPISATSDRRLKNITSKNYNGLEKIKQLKVYNYIFKNDKNKVKHVGVIAQDLQKIFPNSVFEDKDGFFKIKTDEIFYAVINSLKELNKRIIALVKQTNVFEEKITKMEKENQKLKKQIADLSARINTLKK